MHKKHIFLRVFSKITIFACVFCAFFISPVFATLPAGYTELEYIESTGKQKIDTGIIVNSSKLTAGLRMELDAQFLSTNTANAGNGETVRPYFWIGYYYPNQLYCGLGDLYPSIEVSNVFSRHFYVLDSALKKFYIDGNLIKSYDDSIYTGGGGAANITLFNIGTGFYIKQKLYKASIYYTNNLIGNFIPAKRNSDGEIGMYDTVSNTFFTNQGTGDFIAGPVAEIKIATTKMVDDEFAAAEAKLATTVQTIESVVSRTIAQTEQIQILQNTKQTRPDESCPANMKCLLVQDEDGTPHWYPIIEP